jgi:hypothetical protein
MINFKLVRNRLNRVALRLVIKNITIFLMIAKTQTIEGITSKLEHNRHIILWDLDKCDLDEAKDSLTYVQDKYNLSSIAIFSDRENGFCAICYKVVDFITMLRILIDTQYIDNGFVSYTAKRNKATLRVSRKENRGQMKIKAILYSYEVAPPRELERIIYKTGLLKPEEGLRLGNIE